MYLSNSESAPMIVTYHYGRGRRFGSGPEPPIHFRGEMPVDQVIDELPAIAERHGHLSVRHAGQIVHFYFSGTGHTFEYFPDEVAANTRGLEGGITIDDIAQALRIIDGGASVESFLVECPGAKWVVHT